jgi:hypothetical protein
MKTYIIAIAAAAVHSIQASVNSVSGDQYLNLDVNGAPHVNGAPRCPALTDPASPVSSVAPRAAGARLSKAREASRCGSQGGVSFGAFP